jgi:enediyne biosynthesis protein E4
MRHRLRLFFLLPTLFLLSPGCGDNNSGTQLFTRLDKDQTGINFQNTLFDGEALNVLNYIYFYNGGGVAIGDINNDGLPDILFTGNMVHNRLFLNKGNFTFEDITEKSGIASQQGWCTGATMVDINGDGKLDIYICRSADAMPIRRRNLLYINNGDLTFTEKAAEYGLADEGFSTQAAFFDYDKDGDLDLFLINHSLHQYTTGAIENPGWRKESRPSFECKLYRNDWSETLHHPVFTDVSAQAGIHSDVLTFGLGLAISDLNNDGWPDIYVSNDFNEPDYLFMNNGHGLNARPGDTSAVTFTEKLSAGMDQTSLYSMGNDAADFNNDGLVDLMTLDMLPEDNHTQKMHSGAENFNKFQQLFHRGFYYQYSRNMLQKNNGDGTFSEIGQLAGVSNTDWSWSPLFCDFDNDGNKDLLITNGYVRDYTDMDFLKYSADQAMRGNSTDKDQAVKDAIARMPPSPGTSYLYRNNGNSTFTRANKDWGMDQRTVSAGAAYVDLDNDGALDLVISNTNEYAGIYRNNARRLNHNHYLRIALLGQPKNGAGIGSKVKLFCKDTLFYQEAFPVRGFQSSMDPILNFGTGDHAIIDSLLVIWPDDRCQTLYNVKTDTSLQLSQKDALHTWQYKATPVRPLLTPAATPAPIHTENTYNDFDQQPLLLNYLSRRGPCMARSNDYLFMGGTRGHPAQFFTISPGGDLLPSRQPAIEKDSMQDDGAAVFFDANGDGKPDLYVAAGGYELPENDPLLQPRLYLNDGKGHFTKAADALPPMLLNSSCVKAADVDGDGDLDLFIGGRVTPNKYPLSPGSRLLLNDGKGHFTDATPRLAPALDSLGMVTDAVWIDLNNDKQPDLVVVGEWMPIKVFLNNHGYLEDASRKYIRFPSTGWWNRIAIADLDGDGKPDLILGNQGLNNQFSASPKQPLSLYYKDFNHNGTIDPIFCYYIGGVSYPAASRDDLTGELPFLKKKFLEYHTYADATITDLFSPEQLKDMTPLKAETLATCWLQNNGDSGFTQRPLPIEAQYGPVYAISTDDINGDGKPDLLLAGGNQWTRIRFGRYHASHGILLLNDGKGNFRYIPQDQSGLRLRDDTRGVLDLGNKKLIFGINDGPAQIYNY